MDDRILVQEDDELAARVAKADVVPFRIPVVPLQLQHWQLREPLAHQLR